MLLPGKPYPLGAKWDGTGVNFGLYSENATSVDLCLFDSDGKQTECLQLQEQTAFVWHGYLPGISPGQRMGIAYMVRGRLKRGCVSMPRSCWLIHTLRPFAAGWIGRSRFFPTSLAEKTPT